MLTLKFSEKINNYISEIRIRIDLIDVMPFYLTLKVDSSVDKILVTVSTFGHVLAKTVRLNQNVTFSRENLGEYIMQVDPDPSVSGGLITSLDTPHLRWGG